MKRTMNILSVVSIAFVLVMIGCEKEEPMPDNTAQDERQLVLSEQCGNSNLYDFNNYGALHNYYLLDLLQNNNFDETEDLAEQIEAHISATHSINLSLTTVLHGDPYASFDDIIQRAQLSVEFEQFLLPFLNNLFSGEILMNDEYQSRIASRVQMVNTLSSQEDRTSAKIVLAILSHSIYFWLPEEYCGQGGISFVSDHDFGGQGQTRKSWLTNFAEIWSHDLVGGAFGGIGGPGGAAAGFGGASALKALDKAWNNDW